MFNADKELLSTFLATVAVDPAPGASPAVSWSDASSAVKTCKEADPELAAAIEKRDRAGLRAILEAWASGHRPTPEHDKELLKTALKAYRKRLKLTVLDHESTISGSAMSAGRVSNIVGIRPPDTFPKSVWDELVRMKRLVAGDRGTYELPPGA